MFTLDTIFGVVFILYCVILATPKNFEHESTYILLGFFPVASGLE